MLCLIQCYLVLAIVRTRSSPVTAQTEDATKLAALIVKSKKRKKPSKLSISAKKKELSRKKKKVSVPCGGSETSELMSKSNQDRPSARQQPEVLSLPRDYPMPLEIVHPHHEPVFRHVPEVHSDGEHEVEPDTEPAVSDSDVYFDADPELPPGFDPEVQPVSEPAVPSVNEPDGSPVTEREVPPVTDPEVQAEPEVTTEPEVQPEVTTEPNVCYL